MRRGRLVLSVALLALVSCRQDNAEPYVLPSSSDPAVVAEQTRLTTLVERPGVIVVSGALCVVKILGIDGDATYAYVECGGDHGEGAGLPIRVDGDRITRPSDGTPYDDDVREMFPAGLAKLILARDDRVFPEPLPPGTCRLYPSVDITEEDAGTGVIDVGSTTDRFSICLDESKHPLKELDIEGCPFGYVSNMSLAGRDSYPIGFQVTGPGSCTITNGDLRLPVVTGK